MKRLIEHYGGVVLTMFLALIVFASFFNTSINGQKGLPAGLGQIIEMVVLKEQCRVDTGEAFDSYKRVYAPKISLINSYALRANQAVDINEWVKATDASGLSISVSATRTWKDGNEYDVQTLEKGTILFQESGEYWVELVAKDDDGYERTVLTKVFVNER